MNKAMAYWTNPANFDTYRKRYVATVKEKRVSTWRKLMRQYREAARTMWGI